MGIFATMTLDVLVSIPTHFFLLIWSYRIHRLEWDKAVFRIRFRIRYLHIRENPKWFIPDLPIGSFRILILGAFRITPDPAIQHCYMQHVRTYEPWSNYPRTIKMLNSVVDPELLFRIRFRLFMWFWIRLRILFRILNEFFIIFLS
jgi:hypothetical protein